MTEEGKIFVGGLSWDTKTEGLKAYFEKFGPVKDAIVMTDPVTDQPRGFGFVTFKDPSLVPTVCAQDHQLDGKKIDPKAATSREAPVPPADARVTKVFVGGISQNTSEEDLSQYFSQYGTVTKVELKYDPQTNRMRGFGFVDFESEDIVETLVAAHFHNINGKSVEVKKAAPNTKGGGRGGAPKGSGVQSYGGGNQGFYQQQPQQQPGSAGSYGYGYNSQPQGGFGGQGWYNGQAYQQAQGQGYYGQPQSYGGQQNYSQSYGAQQSYGQNYGGQQSYGQNYGGQQSYGQNYASQQSYAQPQNYSYEAGATYGKDNRQSTQTSYSQAGGGGSFYGYTDNSAAVAAGGGSYQGQPGNNTHSKGQQRYQPYSR